MKELVILASDLKASLSEVRHGIEVYITAIDGKYMAASLGSRGLLNKTSKARNALKGDRMVVALKSKSVKELLEKIDEAIRRYGKDAAVIFKKQSEDAWEYAVEIAKRET